MTPARQVDPASPWYQLIALPNQQPWTKKDVAQHPERAHTRIIRANSFVDALRPIYDYMTMLSIASTFDERAGQIAAVVSEFWSAPKESTPDAFDAPSEYALFHSGGVGPMHLVLRDLLVKMHTGHRKFLKEEFLVMIGGSELLTDAEF